MSITKIKILVVDDEPDIIEVILDVFEMYGFEMDSATSGNKAFELTKKKKYDVIISDIRMPDGDGVGLLKKLRDSSFEDPKVLFISGFTDYSLEQLYSFGIDGFFAKPFDSLAVAGAIRNCFLPKDKRWCLMPSDKPEVSLGNDKSQLTFSLGRGGAFFTGSETLPKVGQVVDFSASEKNNPNQNLKGRGTVRWIRGSKTESGCIGFGLEFQYLEPASLSYAKKRIDSERPVAFIPLD
jgi:CheY-like chemotaxis protein